MNGRVSNAVDEYIDSQPEALQVRAAIRRAVPEAVEGIGYGMPGYKLNGRPLFYFAGFKQHYSLFAASGTFFASLEEDLKDYKQRKGTIHFPLFDLTAAVASLFASGLINLGAMPYPIIMIGVAVASWALRPPIPPSLFPLSSFESGLHPRLQALTAEMSFLWRATRWTTAPARVAS